MTSLGPSVLTALVPPVFAVRVVPKLLPHEDQEVIFGVRLAAFPRTLGDRLQLDTKQTSSPGLGGRRTTEASFKLAIIRSLKR